MMKIRYYLAVAAIAVAGHSTEIAAAATADCRSSGADVLYTYDGAVLKGSVWGSIHAFQTALNDTLIACKRQPIDTDGIFGTATRTAIMALGACDTDKRLSPAGEAIRSGAITRALWRALLPDEAIPSVAERSSVLVLSHEWTDYDAVEWNFGTADDRSAMTWGPFGATVGHGNEVRGVLGEFPPDFLRRIFGSEYATIEKLLQSDYTSGYSIFKPIFNDRRRRNRVTSSFAALARHQSARAAYDRYAYESERWLRPGIEMLKDVVVSSGGTVTEIDHAFFLDLAVHARMTEERAEAARRRLLTEETKLRRKHTPAERRRTIGNVFAGFVRPRWQSDRIGRNVVYYVDSIGEANLSKKELSAWRIRTYRAAKNAGLRDCRYEEDPGVANSPVRTTAANTG